MNVLKTKNVKCLRGGEIIATYQFPYEKTLGPSSAPARDVLIEEAKFSLTAENKVLPPYEGITFEVV